MSVRTEQAAAAPPTSPVVGEPGPRRWIVFGTVSLALFMASIDQTIVATALGTLKQDLHAQVNWASWTITIYALGQVIAMPLAGAISDLYGRKRVFLTAVVIFTAASLACGLVSNIYLLVALRLVQALGGGAFMPSATGLVSDEFGRDRDRAIGLFTSIFPIGGIVGPVLGGVFVTYWSWRGIFLVNVPIGIVLLIIGAATLPRGVRKPGARLDLVGVALMAGTLLGLMIGITNLGGGSSFAAPQFLLPAIAGLGLGGLFLRHSAGAPHPFIPLHLIRGGSFGIMNLFNFLFGAAALGFGTLVPLYAQDRYGMSELSAGTLLTARAVGMIGIAALAAYALRRTGYRLPMVVGSLVVACGLGLLALHPVIGSPYVWLALGALVTGVGMGASIPATNNAVLNLAPHQTAAISGLRGMFRQAGAITGISIATAVLARSSDPGTAMAHIFVIFALIVLATIPLAWRVPDHRGTW